MSVCRGQSGGQSKIDTFRADFHCVCVDALVRVHVFKITNSAAFTLPPTFSEVEQILTKRKINERKMVASVLVTIKNLAMRWVGARWRRKKRIVIRCDATFGILIFQSIEIYAHTHFFFIDS